jgi:membrane carboxypeptidase/penicillin-binding protein
VVDPKVAFLINDVLSDNVARSPIFGLNSKLKIEGKTVAVKTGTTNSLKDNWCIGWTPSVLVAAWVGNNDNSPMSWVASGISGATPIWNRIIKELLKNEKDEPWLVPSGIVKVNVCNKEEYFISGTEKGVRCREVTPTIIKWWE